MSGFCVSHLFSEEVRAEWGRVLLSAKSGKKHYPLITNKKLGSFLFLLS